MNTEEKTREEIIRTMTAMTEALTAQTRALIELLDAQVGPVRVTVTPTVTSPDINPPAHTQAEKKPRKAKSAPEPEPTPEPEPVADIKPAPVVKPPSLHDLRLALQACMDKHGMEKAKAALGYERLSVVPDAEIPNVIIRLQSVA